MSLLVGMVATAIFIGSMMKILPQVFKGNKKAETQTNMKVEMAKLFRHIMQVGRLSQGCQRTTGTSPAFVALQCDVDFETPPAGNLTSVRFYYQTGQPFIQYQVQRAGNWVNTIKYGERNNPILSFDLCPPSQMTATNPTCALKPTELSRNFGSLSNTQAAKTPSRDYSRRYFRFAIGAEARKDAPPYVVQSGFFVRNPTDIGAVAYQWGTAN